MSLFTAIYNLVASIVAPSAVPTTPGSTKMLFNIGSLPITVGELKAGVTTLEKFPVAAVKKAITDGLGDLQEDAEVAEDFAGALAAIGVPYANDIDLAIMALAWVAANGAAATSSMFPDLAPPNGGVVGAFLDSLRGVNRPIVVE